MLLDFRLHINEGLVQRVSSLYRNLSEYTILVTLPKYHRGGDCLAGRGDCLAGRGERRHRQLDEVHDEVADRRVILREANAIRVTAEVDGVVEHIEGLHDGRVVFTMLA